MQKLFGHPARTLAELQPFLREVEQWVDTVYHPVLFKGARATAEERRAALDGRAVGRVARLRGALPVLPPLGRAADHGVLWLTAAAVLGLSRNRVARRAIIRIVICSRYSRWAPTACR